MKKARFMSCLMALIMILGLMTTTATAADIHLNVGTARVYMDDVKVSGINAYIDGNGNIRVESESDMLKIFSKESSGIFMAPSNSLIVTDWADFFGYVWSQSDTTLYIYRNSSTIPVYPSQPTNVSPVRVYMDDVKVRGINAYIDSNSNILVESKNDMLKIFSKESEHFVLPGDTLIVTDWANYFGYDWSQKGTALYIYRNSSTIPVYPSQPTIPANPNAKTPAEVFVNGLKVSNADVHTYGGEFFIDTSAALRTIFPKETSSNLPTITDTSSLKTWATNYKYTMVSSGNRVYLNNDGQTPIEVTLNGQYVSFPDQQPILVEAGRTMVPIRTLAEMLGFDVQWVSANEGIKLTKGQTTMWLWVRNTSYYINDTPFTMDAKPFVLNNRTMVPIRFVCEAFGYDVKWDGSGTVSVVRLSSK